MMLTRNVACIALGLLLAFVALPASDAAARPSGDWEEMDSATLGLFKGFMVQYQKKYQTEEELKQRMSIFKANMEVAKEQKRLNPAAEFGVTRFSDLTPEEFRQQYLLPEPFDGSLLMGLEVATVTEVEPEDLPTAFDWRAKGAVTPVKNQAQCGSCWAFSVTETIESAWFLAGHPMANLSEQQIVDCDKTDYGCNGGYPTSAYEYIISAGGLESEQEYPYKAQDGSCQFQKNEVVATISSYQKATSDKNETQMQLVLNQKGPLSICVAASSWQTYQKGVLTTCDKNMDHCVQATGFQNMKGEDGKTYPVWNVRNSWSTDWGVEGYIYLERNKDLCDIAELATIPVV